MGVCYSKNDRLTQEINYFASTVQQNEYQDQIHIIYNFWNQTIAKLDNKEYDDMVVTFYTNALQKIPESTAVFQNIKQPIVKLGRLVFGMFGV